MKNVIKRIIRRTPVLGPFLRFLSHKLLGRGPQPFEGSAAYWETRYTSGADSGVGSYGAFAEFKAEILNTFVAQNRVESVIEFGCGDGNQLTLARYPRYLGFDVSGAAVSRCRELFRDNEQYEFRPSSAYAGEKADLALSLDVIYHLVEDDVFHAYMRTLFAASARHVIIYSSDFEDPTRRDGPHVRHRTVTAWVAENMPAWKLIQHVPNRYPYRGDYRSGSFADFYVYERV
jgi:hypothetical protein